jgi:hypothetical protein
MDRIVEGMEIDACLTLAASKPTPPFEQLAYARRARNEGEPIRRRPAHRLQPRRTTRFARACVS